MKLCRYCRLNSSSSREHVIANSRLRELKNFKSGAEKNRQKQFKGITCESCNNALGHKYESLSPINQAYATVWKVLAGNINEVFARESDYLISKTPKAELESVEDQFLKVIRENRVLPENTFHFDWDAGQGFQEQYGVATKKVTHKVTDQAGNPLEGGKVYFRDRAGGNEESGYLVQTDSDGAGQMEIAMRIELVRVVAEDLLVKNLENNAESIMQADLIIYISQSINTRRIAIIFLLPCVVVDEWPLSKFDFYHRDFLSILKAHFPMLKFKALHPFFGASPQIV